MRQFLLAAASVITAAAVCAAALAATGDPAAASNSATNTATNAVPGKLAANDPNRKVCKRVEATGSHFADHVCMTQAQWDNLTDKSQDLMNDVARKSSQNTGQAGR